LIKSFLSGDAERAESIGIDFGPKEKAAAGVAVAVVTCNTAFYNVGLRLPVVGEHLDKRLNEKLARLLEMYGHADFVTDADLYKVNVAVK
jgi:hypothetical protein